MPRSKSSRKKNRGRRPTASSQEHARTKKIGGGAATGGGINFQAAVTAIAGVKLLRGASLDWFPVSDIPVAVWAESEGPGDDVRVELASAISVEIQVKKGLQRGEKLWEALEGLITAVKDKRLEYGALAVASDSSGTIRNDLAKDLERLGQGRSDHLTDIGTELYRRLQKIGGDWEHACQRVSICVIHALRVEKNSDICAAKESLRFVCSDESQASAAWNVLYRDATALIENRGRWTLRHLTGILEKEGIEIRDGNFPAATAKSLARWVRLTHSSFSMPAVRKSLPLSALLQMRLVDAVIAPQDAEDVRVAFTRYRTTTDEPNSDTPMYDAEWIGRFRRHAVVVAGPGLGKTTFTTLLANSYATDGFAVLAVDLKRIAAAMVNGNSFDNALRTQALDGSKVTPESFDKAELSDLVVIADGLDDCGVSHEVVAMKLLAFAIDHPRARIIVTTRPIGYTTPVLAHWKHYRLLAPDKAKGAVHLAKLLNALRDPEESSEDALEVAKRELAASRAADTIGSSPLFLGMAAALIFSKGKLPQTRPRLYSELIALFETTRATAVPSAVATPIAQRVLNSLGWLLMQDPLAEAYALTEHCASLLATTIDADSLALLERVELAFNYWEKVGIIEQIHHDGVKYWTFVHKTFTEFTAARYLLALSDEQRSTSLEELVDEADWHEVIAFAAGLGLGNEIFRMLVERRELGHADQLERVIALAADKDAAVAEDLVRRLAALAFEAVQAEAGDRSSVGLALSKLAEVHPAIVGIFAAKYLQDSRFTVRLVAWACVASAKPMSYGADEIAAALRTLLPTVSKPMGASLLGGLNFSRSKDRDLLERIALAALAAQADATCAAFADSLLKHEVLGTVGFQNKVMDILTTRGVANANELPCLLSSLSSSLPLYESLDKWSRASAVALGALASAFVTKSRDASDTSSEPPRLPQFGALIALIGYNDVPAYDVYCWGKPYDPIALRTTLLAVVRASAIDQQALSAEAVIVRRTVSNEGFRRLDINIPRVDVPEPDWHKAAALVSDQATLVTAMNHGSRWMAYVAGSILAASRATPEQSRLLLHDAEGSSLWAATEVVRAQQPTDISNSLILDRLAGSLPDGSEYLFKGLENGKVEHSTVLCETIRRGLACARPTIAVAAANLAKDLAQRGQPLEPTIIVAAYDDWLANEQKEVDGVIPPSPREALLKLMIFQKVLDDERLLASLSDARSDVRHVGKEQMLGTITKSKPLRDTVVDLIVLRRLPPIIAASVLQSETPLSGEQIRKLEALLREQNPKWRRVGVELLRSCYLGADQIAKYGARLSTDDEVEIRQAIEQRLLDEIQSSENSGGPQLINASTQA